MSDSDSIWTKQNKWWLVAGIATMLVGVALLYWTSTLKPKEKKPL